VDQAAPVTAVAAVAPRLAAEPMAAAPAQVQVVEWAPAVEAQVLAEGRSLVAARVEEPVALAAVRVVEQAVVQVVVQAVVLEAAQAAAHQSRLRLQP